MSTMNAAELEIELLRVSRDWANMSRRRKSIAICRLDELQGRVMGLADHEQLCSRIKELRAEIKQNLINEAPVVAGPDDEPAPHTAASADAVVPGRTAAAPAESR